MCFVFGALKMRDRIQTIFFRRISKASLGPPSVPWDPYSGYLISICVCCALLFGGGAQVKESATLKGGRSRGRRV